jgi:hypothetical protein
MADKRISQLVERTDIANNDVVPIVASGATTTNKATISSIQEFMQENLDLGVTSVGITLGTTGTDVSVTGSPITTSGNITINLPTASATNRGLLSAADWTTFNNKQAAGNYVTLDTAQTITAQKTFTTSGSSDTMIISHGSGSGFALDVIKAGNSEAIRVTKTSGSGNAMTVIGGNFEAPTIVKTGGTSSQFLKADGSVDSSTYLTTSTAASTYITIATPTTITGVKTFDTGTLILAAAGTANSTHLRNSSGDGTSVSGSNVFGFNSSNNIYVRTQSKGGFIFNFNNGAANRTYTLPDATGTISLTTDLGAYLPLTGGTLTGALNGTSASFTGAVNLATSTGNVGIAETSPTEGRLVINNPNGSTNNGVSGNTLFLKAQTANANLIRFSGAIATDLTIGRFENADAISIGTTSGTEIARFTSGGNVGIGTASPSERLSVNGGVYLASFVGSTTPYITIGTAASGADTRLEVVYDAAGNYGALGISGYDRIFTIKPNAVGIGTASPSRNLHVLGGSGVGTVLKLEGGSGATTYLQLSYNGATNAQSGYIGYDTSSNMPFFTNDTERMRITSDGYARLSTSSGGIQFNGDTAAANALDDYEEGTWTPTIGGTWITNPTSLSGLYTKIGNMVYIRLEFVGGLKANSTSGWIDGLPFSGAVGGGGTVSNVSVQNRGIALLDNNTRVWLTEFDFLGLGTKVMASYRL